jgi:hypothetical protein
MMTAHGPWRLFAAIRGSREVSREPRSIAGAAKYRGFTSLLASESLHGSVGAEVDAAFAERFEQVATL